MAERKQQRSGYWKMMRLIGPHKWLLAGAVAASLAFVVFNSLSIWVTASLINHIVTDFDKLVALQRELEVKSDPGLNDLLKLWTNRWILRDTPVETLKSLCLAILLIFLAKNLFHFVKNYLTGIVHSRVVTDLRNQLFDHLTTLSMSFFNRTRAGELTSIVLNDVSVVRKSLSTSFHDLLVEPVNIVMFTALLFFINWKLSLAVALLLPVAGMLIAWVGRSLRRKSRRSSKQVSGIVSLLQETLGAMRIVKGFVRERFERRRFREETRKHYRLMRQQHVLRYLSIPVTELLGVGIGVMLLWIGGREVLLHRTMDPEDFIRFVFLLFSILGPIKGLNAMNHEIQTALGSADRIFSLLETRPSILESPHAREVADFREALRFDGVSFSYDSRDVKVLRDIRFELRRGEMVAVVGESGSGKSTVADLIPRFYDVTEGAITLDGTDIRTLKLTSLRHLIGIVPQEVILFNDTIRNNIAYGDQSSDEGAIVAAAEAANAREFIEELPSGFETVVGERGVQLSGGQRQRLAIARAILKNPPILILDEATSALDTESEKKVQEAIDRLVKDRTVFVIAHRLSTVVNADRIFVMKEGRIVERGTHSELLQTGGHYRRLYDLQFNV